MLDGPPQKERCDRSKEKEQLGDRCVSPPVYFPKRKQTPKTDSGSTGIGGFSQIFEIQIQIQFLLHGWEKNHGSSWFLVKFNSQQSSSCNSEAGQKYDGGVLPYGYVELGLRMKMNKGRGSAQWCPVPWETMQLELTSVYRKSKSGTEKQQQQQPNSLVWEKIQDQIKSGKPLSRGGFKRCLLVPGFCVKRKWSLAKQKKLREATG